MLHLLPATIGTASTAIGAALMGSWLRAVWRRARESRVGTTAAERDRLRWDALQQTGARRFKRQMALGLLGNALLVNGLYFLVVPGIFPEPPRTEVVFALLGLGAVIAAMAAVGGRIVAAFSWRILERRHREASS